MPRKFTEKNTETTPDNQITQTPEIQKDATEMEVAESVKVFTYFIESEVWFTLKII